MEQLQPPLPHWVQVVSALGPVFTASATLVVGVIVAVIAYRQWRVAHEKLILDLFDKRFAVYSEATSAVREFFHSIPLEKDPVTGVNRVSERVALANAQIARIAILHAVGRRARFLFDEEVAERIKQARNKLIEAMSDGDWDGADPVERSRRSAARAAASIEIGNFQDEFGKLMMKYMRITRAL